MDLSDTPQTSEADRSHDPYGLADEEGGTTVRTFNGPTVTPDRSLLEGLTDRQAQGLAVSVVRTENSDGSLHHELHVGEFVLDPNQWLERAESAVLALHAAGLVGHAMPPVSDNYELTNTVQTSFSDANGLMLTVSTERDRLYEGAKFLEVHLALGEVVSTVANDGDRDDELENVEVACAVLFPSEARETAAALLAAIAVLDVDEDSEWVRAE